MAKVVDSKVNRVCETFNGPIVPAKVVAEVAGTTIWVVHKTRDGSRGKFSAMSAIVKFVDEELHAALIAKMEELKKIVTPKQNNSND